METIEQAKADKVNLQSSIAELVRTFETKYGEGTVFSITIKRWNGSNEASGRVSEVPVDVRLV